MNKIIKYTVTAVLNIAAIILTALVALRFYFGSLRAFVVSINSDIEAKRQELITDGVFLDGVVVDGIPIGGMTYREAKEALSGVEEAFVKDLRFTVRYGVRDVLIIDKSYFNIEYNTDDILSEAIALAEDGDYETLRRTVEDVNKHGRSYKIKCSVTPKLEEITAAVEDAGASLFVAPTEGYVEVVPENVFTGGDRFVYHDGSDGKRARTQDVIDELLLRFEYSAYGTIYMEEEVVKPELNDDSFDDKIVMRASFSTSFALDALNDPARIRNMKRACELINGTVLHPFDPDDPNGSEGIFSAEEAIGPRTKSSGWFFAAESSGVNCAGIRTPGGGVGQVASTLFNAVVCSDLATDCRINNPFSVSYVRPGLEAALESGKFDLVFRNTTSSDVYIFMWVDEAKKAVRAEIWGEPFPEEFDSIEFYSVKGDRIDPDPSTTKLLFADDSGPCWRVRCARAGCIYHSYKVYYKGDEAVSEPVFVTVSYYRAHSEVLGELMSGEPGEDQLSD